MSVRGATGGLRVALAILVLLAIGAQLAAGIGRGGFSVINYLSHFGVLAGFVAGVVLLTHGAATLEGHDEPAIQNLRGAVTLYFTVLLIFSLGSGHILPPQQLGWAAFTLNYILPIALLIDWFAQPPLSFMSYLLSLRWLIFPAAWVVYVLLRGPIANWYPYDMLVVPHLGYGRVIFYLILTFIGGALINLILVRTPAIYSTKPAPAPAPRKSLRR